MQLLSKGFSSGMKPSQTTITETKFIFLPLTAFHTQNPKIFTKEKTLLRHSLINTVPPSLPVTDACLLHLVPGTSRGTVERAVGSNKPCWWANVLWTQTTSNLLADTKAQKGFGSVVRGTELQILLSVWEKQGLRESCDKADRQPFGSCPSAAYWGTLSKLLGSCI